MSSSRDSGLTSLVCLKNEKQSKVSNHPFIHKILNLLLLQLIHHFDYCFHPHLIITTQQNYKKLIRKKIKMIIEYSHILSGAYILKKQKKNLLTCLFVYLFMFLTFIVLYQKNKSQQSNSFVNKKIKVWDK